MRKVAKLYNSSRVFAICERFTFQFSVKKFKHPSQSTYWGKFVQRGLLLYLNIIIIIIFQGIFAKIMLFLTRPRVENTTMSLLNFFVPRTCTFTWRNFYLPVGPICSPGVILPFFWVQILPGCFFSRDFLP